MESKVRELVQGAIHALRSYQYGNGSPDLAKSCADALAQALAGEGERPIVVGASPVCLDCNAAGLRNCSHFDNCEGRWVYKPNAALASPTGEQEDEIPQALDKQSPMYRDAWKMNRELSDLSHRHSRVLALMNWKLAPQPSAPPEQSKYIGEVHPMGNISTQASLSQPSAPPAGEQGKCAFNQTGHLGLHQKTLYCEDWQPAPQPSAPGNDHGI